MLCKKHPRNTKEWRENTGLCNKCAEENGREIFKAQNGKCAICCKDFGKLDNGRVPSAAQLDHDHETGQVRGVLCKNCNLVLGIFEDSPSLFRAAANYLDKWGKTL